MAHASLEALLGVPRAALLRALDRATTAGQLAARLHLAPSGLTHHLRILEPAGLVTRERRGQCVVVRRTRRGTTLLALYDARFNAAVAASPTAISPSRGRCPRTCSASAVA
jgi:DNA-binding MarR family transcriptional regulator